ncbi:MAG: TIGR01458 family HAD-type hydrolase, partial [Chloroflexi bacterium]
MQWVESPIFWRCGRWRTLAFPMWEIYIFCMVNVERCYFWEEDNRMGPVHGVLLDIDGVLQVSMQPIKGAAEVLRWLEQHGYPTCFVTNTTTLACATLAQRLEGIGLPITEDHLITAPVATANYIRQHYPGKRCWVLTKGDTAADFAGIELVQSEADVVVIGGAEELLTYEAMNAAFRMLMNGAVLLAMHTNLYWRTSEGLRLDSGPFVRALEVATSKEAIVLGKPARAFFEQALLSIKMGAHEAIMVGDDIENDIRGAQGAGLRGILVRTGKHQAD